jgi:hypothetical protein
MFQIKDLPLMQLQAARKTENMATSLRRKEEWKFKNPINAEQFLPRQTSAIFSASRRKIEYLNLFF